MGNYKVIKFLRFRITGDVMVKENKKTKYDSPELNLTKSLQHNIKIFSNIFAKDNTLKVRRIRNRFNQELHCGVLYFEGMIDNSFISASIIEPIINCNFSDFNSDKDLFRLIQDEIIISTYVEATKDIQQIIEAITIGDTIIFLEGFSDCLIINSKGWKTRGVTEPSTEKTLRGPKEAFTESLITNISLIRRRVRSSNLKFQFRETGSETNTRICICYLEGIAPQKILDELNSRLDKVEIDGVLDSEYIQEIITDNPLSPFETIGSTERPDVVVGKILEGRIALLVDGTPFVLTLPFLFMEYFQVNEDYYANFFFTSFNRFLRILSFFFSVSVPSLYVALVNHNQEMLPTPLLLGISSARESVPFPTIVEALAMLITFEILREAGTRIPSDMGQAVSIVGALVLGQAAVEARIVSAPIVIVVGLTGIVALLNIKMKGVNILLRFTFLFLAAFMGIYGIVFGIIGVLIYTMGLSSFGVPYMFKIGSIKMEHIKDSFVRSPWWYLSLKTYKVSVKTTLRRKKMRNTDEK